MRIVIEPLLFMDYAVAVYDESNNLQLDKKYFCAGIKSAHETARHMLEQDHWKGLKVYFQVPGGPEVLLDLKK